MNTIIKKTSVCRALLIRGIGFISLLLINMNILADGSFIDKVYHPYVQPGEREFEFRFNLQKDDEGIKDKLYKYHFSYGQSINENWFAEIYLIVEQKQNNAFKITAIELEALWQLTEQGEYDEDWGLLFEVEHEHNEHITELSTALIIEKEWHKWVGTANLYLIYEWGSEIENEFETAMALQTRYRYSRSLEPAIEFYSSDASEGIGPVLLGQVKLNGRKKIYWEAGVIFGLDNKTADQTFKFLLEFEF